MFFLFRFKGFCVSILLISLAFTTTFQKSWFLHKKRKQNQTVPISTEMPSSGTLVGLQLNVVRENDQMISFNTVIMYSIVSISFLMIWLFYSSSTAGFIYYNLSIGFFLAFTITPPLYFFKNLSRFKIAISVVYEMFS